jgi:hypothetical protein
MRGSARVVWRLLDGGATGVDDAVSALLAGHPDAPPSAADEVRAFVNRLLEHELLRAATEATAAPEPPSEDLGPYAAPVVEAFTDMQELVLLDPVHDVGAEGWPNRPAEE